MVVNEELRKSWLGLRLAARYDIMCAQVETHVLSAARGTLRMRQLVTRLHKWIPSFRVAEFVCTCCYWLQIALMMASDLAIGSNEQTSNNQFGRVLYDQTPGLMPLCSEAFIRSSRESSSDGAASSSLYTLASDDSRYNYETTRDDSATEDTGVQNSRQVLVQRATLAPSNSLDRSGIMYVMALLMPLVSSSSFDIQWRCTPSAILHASEITLLQISRLIAQVRGYLRQLANDQIARDLFATAMDVVLVIYAIGFLFLSLYQASIFA